MVWCDGVAQLVRAGRTRRSEDLEVRTLSAAASGASTRKQIVRGVFFRVRNVLVSTPPPPALI